MHSPLTRTALAAFLVLVSLSPLLGWAAWQGVQAMQNTPILWLPPDFPERQEYEWFRQSFRVRDSIVVSWRGCTVDDVRLQALAEAVREWDGARDASLALFDRVTDGYTALREMTSEPLELDRATALRRLEGNLVGRDGKTSCAIVTLTEYGAAHSTQAVGAIQAILSTRLGVAGEDAFLAGSPVESVAINVASARSIQWFLVPSGLLVLLLTRLCLKSWPLTIAIIAIALFGEVLALGLVHLSGATMNAVLIVMAPLVFVLTVSAGVHLANYYHEAVRLQGVEGAAGRAVRAGWAPCGLAALTTAVGLTSLCVSTILPVRHFGLLAAASVLIVTAILFLLLPGVMEKWPRRRPRARDGANAREPGPRAWQPWAGFVSRRCGTIVLLAVAVMATAAVGLVHLRSTVSILGLVVPESRIVRDYRWLETNIGPMVPIDVVLELDRNNALSWPAKISLLQRIEDELRDMDQLSGSMSAASFVPPIPRSRSFRDAGRRALLESHFQSQRPQFREAGFLHETAEHESWRITTRAPALEQIDYGLLMAGLRDRVEPVLQIGRDRFDLKLRATYTGITPLVHAAQEVLLHDLVTSFLTALGLVALVMILLLRNLVAALLVMIPNVFPTILLFGMLGWTGTPVDIGSMMTASVALGIAIDGTLHFLTWYRRELRARQSSEQAITQSFRHCATAMSQTALICGVGLLVFALSEFLPTQRFAWMMLLLLLAALVGDLLLLPALLAFTANAFPLVARPQPSEERRADAGTPPTERLPTGQYVAGNVER